MGVSWQITAVAVGVMGGTLKTCMTEAPEGNPEDVQTLPEACLDRSSGPEEPVAFAVGPRLLGTIVANDPAHSSALVRGESDAFAQGYAIGDPLLHWTVVRIERDGIALERSDGDIEWLAMENRGVGCRPPLDQGPSEVRRIDQGKLIQASREPARLGREKALLHRNAEGSFDGIRLTGFAEGSRYDALGLQRGDIVHCADGYTFGTLGGMSEFWARVEDRSSFCLQITRRRRPIDLCYELIP